MTGDDWDFEPANKSTDDFYTYNDGRDDAYYDRLEARMKAKQA